MKFFLDTADIEEIKRVKELGLLDGVTTNPTLTAKVVKEPKRYDEIISEICRICDGPVSVEVLSSQFEQMVEEAKHLSRISRNVVIKIPITEEGVRATGMLTKEGIKVNMTLIFSAAQGLIAAKAGATYASPFIGRLDDAGHVGMEIVKQIKTIYNNYGFKTQIIVASIRHPLHVIEAALAGADIATIPYSVFEKLFKHPLTQQGIEIFMKDYLKAFGQR